MERKNSDRSSFEKSIAQNVHESAECSSQVWHHNENTRSGIEKSIAKADQHSRIEKSIAKIQNRFAGSMAREMGSRRHVDNRRRRTREGPELACVRAPFSRGVAHVGCEG